MATAVLTRTALPNRARALRRAFEARFAEVTMTPTVWRNLPPAAVLLARQPRPAPEFRSIGIEDHPHERQRGLGPGVGVAAQPDRCSCPIHFDVCPTTK
jgi:hypothetical protein